MNPSTPNNIKAVSLIDFTHLYGHRPGKLLCYQTKSKNFVLPVKILKQTDQGTIIKLFKPKQMNWGRGPTTPQYYYLLNNNNQVGIYYQPPGSKDGRVGLFYQPNNFDFTFENKLITGQVDDPIHMEGITWKSALPIECTFCLEEQSNLTLFNCLHWPVCQDCSHQLHQCPICQQEITNKIPIVDITSHNF